MRISCAHQNISIVPNRLLFSVLKAQPRSSSQTYYFTVENNPSFQYKPFFSDFGPPSILQLHRFVHLVKELLSERKESTVHFYSSPSPTSKSNLALYITFFRMVHFNLTPSEAFRPLEPIAGKLRPFRDASTLSSTFDLTVMDCLKGIYKAIENKWYDFQTFDAEKWEFLEKIENGDMNWIVPNKLLALASPYSFDEIPSCENPSSPKESNPPNESNELNRTADKNEKKNVTKIKVATPKTVIPTFKEMKIDRVVRLNKQFYNASEFREAGIAHSELYFPDGSLPPFGVLEEFLGFLDAGEVVAVHCRAGLGRAGTLCGCYLKKEFGFTGREALGWLRVCRPGSVIGGQQQFLMRFLGDRDETAARPATSRHANFALNSTVNNINNLGNINNIGNISNIVNTSGYNFSYGGSGPAAVSSPSSARGGFVNASLQLAQPSVETARSPRRMLTTPGKGFSIDIINVADFYNNNPKTRQSESKRFTTYKLWTMPREKLMPVLTLPVNSSPFHPQPRKINQKKAPK